MSKKVQIVPSFTLPCYLHGETVESEVLRKKCFFGFEGKAEEIADIDQRDEFHEFHGVRVQICRLIKEVGSEEITGVELSRLSVLIERFMALRASLCEINIGLVFATVRRKIWGHHEQRDDLVGDGTLTLLKCLWGFNPYRGFRFSSYAFKAIYTDILRILARQKVHRPLCYSLNTEDAILPTTLVTPPPTPSLEWAIDRIRQILDDPANGLSLRELFILRQSYTYDVKPPTLDTIGKDLGISKERVRQIRNKTLHKLKTQLTKVL